MPAMDCLIVLARLLISSASAPASTESVSAAFASGFSGFCFLGLLRLVLGLRGRRADLHDLDGGDRLDLGRRHALVVEGLGAHLALVEGHVAAERLGLDADALEEQRPHRALGAQHFELAALGAGDEALVAGVLRRLPLQRARPPPRRRGRFFRRRAGHLFFGRLWPLCLARLWLLRLARWFRGGLYLRGRGLGLLLAALA
jgi:hypothetical protein